ncbi:MAG: sigma-70 family RNA polymerase sigma factor [Kiritimatiellae bacterium]|nr:sigma-70 family RNA polymerase sigma factor [Kiritimatiellia bacterium]
MTIVDEIRQDPQQGAKRLESEYRAGLTTLARRFCDDDGDAAELVNRTFAEVVASIDRYAEQSAFFGWMSRILVNLHTKDVRRKSNETVFSDDILPDVAPDPDAEARIFREVDASILRDAIDGLPADMKETLLLHYFMDLPVGKVGKILSIPDGTVKWRLHYAREILAAKLGAAAKKPGAKALLVVLALAALTAAGAAIAGARAARPQDRNADEPSALRQDAAQSWTGGTGGTEGTGETDGFDVAFILPVQSSFETDSSTTQTTTEEQTMNTTTRTAALGAATTLALAAAPPAVTADSSQNQGTPSWDGQSWVYDTSLHVAAQPSTGASPSVALAASRDSGASAEGPLDAVFMTRQMSNGFPINGAAPGFSVIVR